MDSISHLPGLVGNVLLVTLGLLLFLRLCAYPREFHHLHVCPFGCLCCYCSLLPHDATVGVPLSWLMPHLQILGLPVQLGASNQSFFHGGWLHSSSIPSGEIQGSSCRLPSLTVRTVTASQPSLHEGSASHRAGLSSLSSLSPGKNKLFFFFQMLGNPANYPLSTNIQN